MAAPARSAGTAQTRHWSSRIPSLNTKFSSATVPTRGNSVEQADHRPAHVCIRLKRNRYHRPSPVSVLCLSRLRARANPNTNGIQRAISLSNVSLADRDCRSALAASISTGAISDMAKVFIGGVWACWQASAIGRAVTSASLRRHIWRASARSTSPAARGVVPVFRRFLVSARMRQSFGMRPMFVDKRPGVSQPTAPFFCLFLLFSVRLLLRHLGRHGLVIFGFIHRFV